MKPISLIPLSHGCGAGEDPPSDRLAWLAAALARTFHTPCEVRPKALDVSFALDNDRQQYWSTAILRLLQNCAKSGERVLGVTACDLYVPVLTFVFGEAQLEGNCAVVSMARLSETFYGLPPREELARARLIKEAVHELGHTFGLQHCKDWQCVMSSSHAVERLDMKGSEFCPSCRHSVFRGARL